MRHTAILFLAITGCGLGLQRYPGEGQSSPVQTGSSHSLGPIGTPCGALGAGGLRTVALSPDDRVAALGYGSGRVTLHDAASGAPLHSFDAHGVPASASLFLADGTVVTGAANGEVKLWSPSGNPVLPSLIGAATTIQELASANGDTVLFAREKTVVRAWRRSDGRPLWVAPFDEMTLPRIIVVAGRGLLLAAIGRAELRDFVTGQPIALDLAPFSRDTRVVRDVSPDGTRALMDHVPMDETDPRQGLAVLTFPAGERLWFSRELSAPWPGPAFSADGSRIVLVHNEALSGNLQVVEANTGNALAFFDAAVGEGGVAGHAGDRVMVRRPSADGQELVMRLSDGTGWTRSAEPGDDGDLQAVAVSPDGATVVTVPYPADDSVLRVWDVASGEQRLARRHTGTVAFSPDGHTLAVSGGVDHPPAAGSSAATPEPGAISVLAVDSGGVIRSFGHLGCYLPVFTSDGEHLWAACRDAAADFDQPTATLRRFRLADGSEEARIDRVGGRPVSLALSPDGQLLAVRDDRLVPNALAVWDAASGRRLWQAEPTGGVHYGVVIDQGNLAFSPDGQQLAVWSRRSSRPGDPDSRVSVYAARTGRPLVVLAHDTISRSGNFIGSGLAFSADGSLLAALGSQVVVWRTSDWSPFDPFGGALPSPRNGAGLAFSAAGDIFFAGADFRLHRQCQVRLPPAE
jgi:WD40 repeat protein